jgi:hypothetical protein
VAKKRYAKALPTVQAAIDILGANRVIMPEELKYIYGENFNPKSATIRNSEQQLIEAGEENGRMEVKSDWRFIPANGFSFPEMIGIFGVGNDLPFFNPKSLWLLNPNQIKWKWTLRHPVPGYRLIDFSGRFPNHSWQKMNDKIKALGTDYKRADEAIFTEAALTIFKATGTMVAKDWYHWSNAVGSGQGYVCVGASDSPGWLVIGYLRGGSGLGLRVAVARKFV